VELKLQVEQLRRRVDEDRERFGLVPAAAASGLVMPVGIMPPAVRSEGEEQRPGGLLVKSGMTMAEIERAAIENALRETRGNRRKAAEILAIGERTLYRKLKEYGLPVGQYDSDN
jgi:DNA-binding NtrC family response regulator